MVAFGKKKSYTEYLYTRPAIAVISLLVVLLSIAVFERYVIEREMYTHRAEAESERQEALARKIQLQEKVTYLEGERGMEEELRKNFDVAQAGEQVVILVGNNEDPAPAGPEKVEEKHRWYQFWK